MNERAQRVLALFTVAAVAVYALCCVRAAGVLALSDDDYARIVIAASQADEPHLDPSGTSWLPLPFWLYGAAIACGSVFHIAPLDSARLVPWPSSVVGLWLVYAAARVLRASRVQACLSAGIGIGAVLVAQLASMTGPEYLTACLCCFALAARAASHDARHSDSDPRALGMAAALCANLAALSRYEAWPVAAVIALSGVVGRRRDRLAWGVAEAGVALSGPVFWLAHNASVHGDALHFLGRVSAYRATLGARFSAGEVLLAYGRALLVASPLLSVASVLVALRSAWSADKRAVLGLLTVPAIGALAMLLFLIAGALSGGVPTHHPERALLVVWLLAGLAVATYARVAWPLCVLALAILPFTASHTDGFSRAEQEALGRRLRGQLRAGERVLIATPDYGYYAVMAGLGQSDAAWIDQDHDPRHAVASSHFRGDADVTRLRSRGVRYVVAPRARWAEAYHVQTGPTLSLYDLQR